MAGRTAIGLDIGTSGVRAAEVTFGKGEITLAKFGQVALQDGAVRDGEVMDVDAVGQAIKELWAHTKFSSTKVVLGVANQKVLVRQIDLPYLEGDELKRSLPFQVGDYIPMPVEHAVLDFYPLEEVMDDNNRLLRGLLVAASREMVLNSVHAAQKGGLTPTTVDLSSFAVLRSLGRSSMLGLGGDSEALVDVGAKVTNIVIHQGGSPRFIRILLMGGQDLTETVAERMGVSLPQAETLKQQQGLDGDENDPAGRVLQSGVATFLDEVRGSLDYFQSSQAAPRIGRILLTGGGSRLTGLAAKLEQATRVPVEIGSPFESMSMGKTGLSTDQINFVEPLAVVPVGLALGAA